MAIDNSLLICPAVLQLPFVDKSGIPLSGGVITFYEEDQTTLKNVYIQTGTYPNFTYVTAPNPMTLTGAGTPADVGGNDVILFYYPYVESGPNMGDAQPYFVTAYNAQGLFEWSRTNFPFSFLPGPVPPPSETGPQFENYLINNRFWHNIGTINVGTISTTATSGTWTTQYNNSGTKYYQTLAPDQHAGFSMPDINYIQDQNGGTQTITFNKFSPSNTLVMLNDVQPEYYINYHCTADSSGAMLKVIQFPVSLHLATLAGQDFAFTIQTQVASGVAPTLTIYLYQFNGTGVASPSPVEIGQVVTQASSNWNKSVIVSNFAVASNTVVSGTNDDAWYIQIGFPVGSSPAPCNVNIAIPSIYIDSSITTETQVNAFSTYDQIDSVISTPRTGDVRISMNDFYPFGWLPLNGGTLATTGTITAPTGLPITYQGADGWPLYQLIWNKFNGFTNGTTNLVAQLYSSAGSAVAYGISAQADWNAKNQISLTSLLGQIILGRVPASSMPIQYKATFTASQLSAQVTFSGTNGNTQLVGNSAQSVCFGEVLQFTVAGGSLPPGISLATNYYATPLSSTTYLLSTSLANAQNGVYISFTSAGSGTLTQTTFSLVLTAANAMNLYTGVPITFSTTGSLPGNIDATHVFYGVPISSTTFAVASSFTNAIQGNLLAYSNAGSPTNTVTLSLVNGQAGQYNHTQLIPELALHNHATTGIYSSAAPSNQSYSAVNNQITPILPTPPGAIYTTGESLPFNVIQPSTYMNMYIRM